MRAAIFGGLEFIGECINPAKADEISSILAYFFILFLVADLIDFVRKNFFRD